MVLRRDAFLKIKTTTSHLDSTTNDNGKAFAGRSELPELSGDLYELRKRADGRTRGQHGTFHFDNSGSAVRRLGKRLPQWVMKLAVDAVTHFHDERIATGYWRLSFFDVEVVFV